MSAIEPKSKSLLKMNVKEEQQSFGEIIQLKVEDDCEKINRDERIIQ